MTRGEARIWALAPLAILAVLVLVLGVYLPPQLETLLNQATDIALAGQAPVVSANGVINLARMLIP
jgi:hypothetical protein